MDELFDESFYGSNRFIQELLEDEEADIEDNAPEEVTETLGAMLPQIPLSESTIEYILNPEIEMSESVIKNITDFGKNLAVSAKTKDLLMKKAVTEKRVQLAGKRKLYKKYVPKIQKELDGYNKELNKLKQNQTPKEKADMTVTNTQIKNSINNNHKIKKYEESVILEGYYKDKGFPKNRVPSSIKIMNAPILVSANKNAANRALAKLKPYTQILEPICKKTINLAMKQIIAEKRLDPSSTFTPIYCKYQFFKDHLDIDIYGDIDDVNCAIITPHIKDGKCEDYDIMTKVKSKVTEEAFMDNDIDADVDINVINPRIIKVSNPEEMEEMRRRKIAKIKHFLDIAKEKENTFDSWKDRVSGAENVLHTLESTQYVLAKKDFSNYIKEAANIEPEMKPIVDKLNSLGYKVKYASPGHKNLRKKEDNKDDGVYYNTLYTDARIMFEEDYKFGDAPKGWKWRTVDKCDYLDVIPKKYSGNNADEAFAKWKEQYMDSLKNWVKSLPQKEESPITRANDNTSENKKRKTEEPNIIKHESFDDITIESYMEDFKDRFLDDSLYEETPILDTIDVKYKDYFNKINKDDPNPDINAISDEDRLKLMRRMSSEGDKIYNKFMSIAEKNPHDPKLKELHKDYALTTGKLPGMNFKNKNIYKTNKEVKEMWDHYREQNKLMSKYVISKDSYKKLYGESALDKFLNDSLYEEGTIKRKYNDIKYKKYLNPEISEKILNKKFGDDDKSKQKYYDEVQLKNAQKVSDEKKIKLFKKWANERDKIYNKFMVIAEKNPKSHKLKDLYMDYSNMDLGKINFIDKDILKKNKDMDDIMNRQAKEENKMLKILK